MKTEEELEDRLDQIDKEIADVLAVAANGAIENKDIKAAYWLGCILELARSLDFEEDVLRIMKTGECSKLLEKIGIK